MLRGPQLCAGGGSGVQSAWEVYQGGCETVLCRNKEQSSQELHYSRVLGGLVGPCADYGQIIAVESDALPYPEGDPK